MEVYLFLILITCAILLIIAVYKRLPLENDEDVVFNKIKTTIDFRVANLKFEQTGRKA